MKKISLFAAMAMLACLAACDNPQRVADQTRKDLDAFRADSRVETQAKVEADFTKLDEEISKLEKKTDAATGDSQKKLAVELQKLNSERAAMVADYRAAKVNKVIDDLKSSVKEIGNAVKNLAKPTNGSK